MKEVVWVSKSALKEDIRRSRNFATFWILSVFAGTLLTFNSFYSLPVAGFGLYILALIAFWVNLFDWMVLSDAYRALILKEGGIKVAPGKPTISFLTESENQRFNEMRELGRWAESWKESQIHLAKYDAIPADAFMRRGRKNKAKA